MEKSPAPTSSLSLILWFGVGEWGPAQSEFGGGVLRFEVEVVDTDLDEVVRERSREWRKRVNS